MLWRMAAVTTLLTGCVTDVYRPPAAAIADYGVKMAAYNAAHPPVAKAIARSECSDPTITNPYLLRECGSSTPAVARSIAAAEREAARNMYAAASAYADEAECRNQAQAVAASSRGVLMPSFEAMNSFNLCLEARAARRYADGLQPPR